MVVARIIRRWGEEHASALRILLFSAVGALLGASYVLSGGVRLADSTLFVQAVRARDGSHVFAWRGKTAGRSTDSVFRDLAAALTQRAEVW